MTTILDIYKGYKIMPSLQKHMLQVTAVASMICDSLDVPTEKDDIILATLLHDMGNIVKFNLSYFPEFLESEGLEYWKNIKNQYIEKYGSDEHKATEEILKEMGRTDKIRLLARQNRFTLFCSHRDSGDINIKIIHYADMRVGPKGVMSYDERMEDAHIRYKDSKSGLSEIEKQKLVSCGKEIEKQIFVHSKIKPEDITNESIASLVESLKGFVIK